MTTDQVIEIKGLSKSFGNRKILKDISFQVKEGEIFALLGPSGAGKTTLINILTGQLKATEGMACFLGKNTEQLKEQDYRQMGMMLDNLGLYERLSCYDNLQVFADIVGVPKQRVDEVLKRIGLWEARKSPAARLSKGMRGRLGFARAVLSKPKVLFLDEPTSGLDPATAEGIHRLLLEEKSKGTTIFLTTHNMFEAQKLCDHVAILNEGRIVTYGEPEEICRRHNHDRRFRIRLRSGEELMLVNEAESAEKMAELLRKGEVETIHSMEPDMETVFMELTGRRFS